MKNVICLSALLMVAGGFSACAQKTEAPAPAAEAPATPTIDPHLAEAQKAGQVAKQIRQNPAAAEQILSTAGWTAEQFNDLLYQIAGDAILTANFQAAQQ